MYEGFLLLCSALLISQITKMTLIMPRIHLPPEPPSLLPVFTVSTGGGELVDFCSGTEVVVSRWCWGGCLGVDGLASVFGSGFMGSLMSLTSDAKCERPEKPFLSLSSPSSISSSSSPGSAPLSHSLTTILLLRHNTTFYQNRFNKLAFYK